MLQPPFSPAHPPEHPNPISRNQWWSLIARPASSVRHCRHSRLGRWMALSKCQPLQGWGGRLMRMCCKSFVSVGPYLSVMVDRHNRLKRCQTALFKLGRVINKAYNWNIKLVCCLLARQQPMIHQRNPS